MSYLVCHECGSYYELQPGETPEDFDLTCQCGGRLENKESIEPENEFDLEKGKSEDLEKENEFETPNKSAGIWKRAIAILIGVIIIILSMLSLGGLPVLIPVIAGFLTGFIAWGSYKDGILNSAIACGVGGTFSSFLYIFSYFLTEGGVFCAHCTAIIAISFIIPSIVFGIIGGILAIFIRNKYKG